MVIAVVVVVMSEQESGSCHGTGSIKLRRKKEGR
jgi:hypothetical protein